MKTTSIAIVLISIASASCADDDHFGTSASELTVTKDAIFATSGLTYLSNSRNFVFNNVTIQITISTSDPVKAVVSGQAMVQNVCRSCDTVAVMGFDAEQPIQNDLGLKNLHIHSLDMLPVHIDLKGQVSISMRSQGVMVTFDNPDGHRHAYVGSPSDISGQLSADNSALNITLNLTSTAIYGQVTTALTGTVTGTQVQPVW